MSAAPDEHQKLLGAVERRLVEIYNEIAAADLRELFDDSGNIKPHHEWPPLVGRMVELYERRPDGEVRIRFVDKFRALAQLAGLLRECGAIHPGVDPSDEAALSVLHQAFTIGARRCTPKQRAFLRELPEHDWNARATGRAMGVGLASLNRWYKQPAFACAIAARQLYFAINLAEKGAKK